VTLEFRATTKSQRMRLSAVMISSTLPSAKYSCSGSPLILASGSTAIDRLSGNANTGLVSAAALRPGAHPIDVHRPGNVLELLLAGVFKG